MRQVIANQWIDMLLKFKNKHTMALDKMIKEANDIGGMIDCIVLDLKEGYGLILELVNLGAKHVGRIKITDLDGIDITRREIIWNGTGVDKNEHVKTIVNSWYKLHFKVKYDDIPLVIVKPKAPDVPAPKSLPEPVKKTAGWMDDNGHAATEDGWVEKFGYDPVPALRRVTKTTHTSNGNTVELAGKLDVPKPPPKPLPPPGRIIQEGNIAGVCEKCGSSLKTKFFFFRAGGCIQPECENYWDKD